MTSKAQFIFLFFFVILQSNYGFVNIEKFLKVCERNSVDVNDCLVDAVQQGIAYMANGIPALNVPAIDPHHQKELRIDYKNNQIQVHFAGKDIYFSGLKSSTVRDVRLRADEDKFHMEVDMKTPLVQIRGKYRADSRYNSEKIQAHGSFISNLTNLVYTWKIDGKPENKDNGTFVKITSFYMRPDVGNVKTDLTNNNPKSKHWSDLGTTLTNENWRVLYREILPFTQINWNRTGTKIANKIFLKVPYKQLFPIKP